MARSRNPAHYERGFHQIKDLMLSGQAQILYTPTQASPFVTRDKFYSFRDAHADNPSIYATLKRYRMRILGPTIYFESLDLQGDVSAGLSPPEPPMTFTPEELAAAREQFIPLTLPPSPGLEHALESQRLVTELFGTKEDKAALTPHSSSHEQSGGAKKDSDPA